MSASVPTEGLLSHAATIPPIAGERLNEISRVLGLPLLKSAPQKVNDLTVQTALFLARPLDQRGVQIGRQSQNQTDEFLGHNDSIYHLDTFLLLCYYNDTTKVSRMQRRKLRMPPLLNIAGQRFGRLVAISPERRENSIVVYWQCRCDCGNTTSATLGNLKRGHVTSCGCYRRELTIKRDQTHGKSGTRVYECWLGMRRRCQDPSRPDWPNYGGRGITVCSEWGDFARFYADMGDPPKGHSLDRIDNDRGYSPDNCRWAPKVQQNRNTRSIRPITYAGETLTVGEWAERFGLPRRALYYRIRNGWPLEKAFTTPVGVVA